MTEEKFNSVRKEFHKLSKLIELQSKLEKLSKAKMDISDIIGDTEEGRIALAPKYESLLEDTGLEESFKSQFDVTMHGLIRNYLEIVKEKITHQKEFFKSL